MLTQQNQPNSELSFFMMIPRKSSVPNTPGGQQRVANVAGTWLSGVKALLRATPEKIWYADQSGTRHSSVVQIGATIAAGFEGLPLLRSAIISILAWPSFAFGMLTRFADGPHSPSAQFI
jgi:hypothetical protein